jgi:hypothetical protein
LQGKAGTRPKGRLQRRGKRCPGLSSPLGEERGVYYRGCSYIVKLKDITKEQEINWLYYKNLKASKLNLK